jgi:hypothetical protein
MLLRVIADLTFDDWEKPGKAGKSRMLVMR